ncbi:coagulation factor XIII A chain [Gadus morhua]|uniref:coagulation factor XIII A chain n=1 Tax=Gadus morhua TaxID=8049 RepID=UPI0011B8266B|nr:coagulation factor XIII A chain-like [Gadus morhua]XP_030194377.1 coagulation factor XIII A chain-like [Gadus morhua]XP_030194378.1 coagulation factor XIII A chain-like [Gadus morhua]
MADADAAVPPVVVPSSAPPPAPPGGAPPKVTHHGRVAAPVASSNEDTEELPEFEPFGAPGPRGFPSLAEYLDISKVDMMKNRAEINHQQHHTDRFNTNFLIVRRGQEFQVKITFNRPYDADKDKFAVEFGIGPSPQFSKRTYMPVFPTPERQSPWAGRVVVAAGPEVTMGITPTADAIVGRYRLYVAVVTPYGIRRTCTDVSRDLYILYNPWVKEDVVFLEDEEERDECVLNESGVIYHGTWDDIAERNWNFGQFDFGVLDACLYVMDRAGMPIVNRGDPVKMARIASAMLNSRDDDGVLVGSWSGDYSYGVAPTSWTGSTDILLSYYRTRKPVGYAQCWVYAAVFNSFLRCLGIPARVVTNFYSAHDNDGNLKTDIILDENGRIDRKNTRDSIWNYHCWNECFMARADLPTGFGGWQAVDATPQETSDGMFRCGPASVRAIKHGELCFPFDAAFVFAEVNSDVVFHSRKRDGTMEVVKVKKDHVGRLILTKATGSYDSRDITELYKFPEGSVEERTVLEKGEVYGCARDQSTLPEADVELRLPALEVAVGDDFELCLEAVSRSGESRTVDAYITGSVVYYTGVTSADFLFKTPTLELEANQSVKELWQVPARSYMKKLVEQANLHFIATGKVKETGQIITAMKVVALHMPKLSIKVSGLNKVNELMVATVDFTNPFSLVLEHVYVRVEGAGVLSPVFKYYGLIPGGSRMTWTEEFTPRRAGPTRLIATLDCAALRQVSGQLELDVLP